MDYGVYLKRGLHVVSKATVVLRRCENKTQTLNLSTELIGHRKELTLETSVFNFSAVDNLPYQSS